MFVRRTWVAAVLGSLLLLSACGGASTPAATPPSSSSSGSGSSAPANSSPASTAASSAAKPAAGSTTAASNTVSSTAPASSTSLPTLSIGYPTPSGSYTPLFVGQDEGLFAKNGIKVNLHVMRGGASESSALLSGSLQLVLINTPSALAAMAKGVKTVLVGKMFPGVPFTLWAKPSITSIKQLEGKKLALQHVASFSAAATQVILPEHGVDLSKVTLQYLGSPSNAIAALIAGKVDAAASTAPPIFKAKAKGFKMIFDFRQGTHMAEAFLVTRKFAQQHPDQVEDFLKGWVQAVGFVKDKTNEAKVNADLGKAMQVTNKEILDETYDYYAPMFTCDPTLTTADMTDAETYMTKFQHTKIDLAGTIDPAPATAVTSSGFVTQNCKS